MPCKIVGGTKVPGNEKSWERKFLWTKGPGNESSQELSFPGNERSRKRKGPGTKVLGNFRSQTTKVPGNEKSRERKFPIGTIRSWERKVLGTKSPGTPLLVFPCTIKSISSLLAPTHAASPGKRAVKWLWCGVVFLFTHITYTHTIQAMMSYLRICLRLFEDSCTLCIERVMICLRTWCQWSQNY